MSKFQLKNTRFKKINVRVILAGLTAIFSLFYLYDIVVPDNVREIEYKQYVRAVVDIPADTKIESEMLEYAELPIDKIPSGVIQDQDEVRGKYAAAKILKEEPIRLERIKTQVESEFGSEERTVRIYTNLQAYGGVGPGDRADLIFTGEIGEQRGERIGKIEYEGVLIERVFNDNGTNIEQIKKDEYNQGNMKPYLVEISASQEMAQVIETLQEDNKINFKFTRWTERSEAQGTEGRIYRSYNLIESQGRQSTPVVREVD